MKEFYTILLLVYLLYITKRNKRRVQTLPERAKSEIED
jgi:hypothetical protein